MTGDIKVKNLEQAKTARQDYHYLLARLVFELRLCLSWTWVLPIIGVAVVLIVMVTSKTPLAEYSLVMRKALELGLPLVGVFLVVPLLEKEWTQSTLTQLALRKPLIRVLLLRLFLVLIYLTLIVIAATLASPGNTHFFLDTGGTMQWIAAVVLTTGAPTLLLVTLALLVTHITISAISGYLVALSVWFVNLIIAIILLSASGNSGFLSFGLFGWPVTSNPNQSDWFVGKICLLIIGTILLIAEFPLLRNEIRLVRNSVE